MKLSLELPSAAGMRSWPAQLRWLAGRPRHATHEIASDDDDLGSALGNFSRGDWAAAFAELRRLAARGVPQAARMALTMHAHGPRVFGGRFDVPVAELRSWEAQASLVAEEEWRTRPR